MPPRKSTRKKATRKRAIKLSTSKKRVTRRKRSTQKGRGIVGDIHNFVKDNQLLSKGIRALGHPEIADVADKAGYGRKKPASRRRTLKGCGVFSDLGKGISNLFGSGPSRRRQSMVGSGVFSDLRNGMH